VAWVAKDQWVHVKIEYYQDKQLYRQGTFSDVRIIDDIPTPFRAMMENVKTGHRTGLTIEEIRYHTRFDDDLFTQRSLERAGK
jgi:outer membrane lipoprotein-sorting protein